MTAKGRLCRQPSAPGAKGKEGAHPASGGSALPLPRLPTPSMTLDQQPQNRAGLLDAKAACFSLSVRTPQTATDGCYQKQMGGAPQPD